MTDVSLSPDVVLIDGVLRVSSLEIAEHFQKQHKHVLRTIRKIISESSPEFIEPNFGLTNYSDDLGRELPMYQLSRDGFTLLAMGFAGKKALEWKIKYIQAFNAMDEALKKKNEKQAIKEAKRKALPRAQVALPSKSYEEECREAVAELVSLRGELFRVTSRVSDILSLPFGRATQNNELKPFARPMNFAIQAFVVAVYKNLETVELLFKSYVEAEKLIRK